MWRTKPASSKRADIQGLFYVYSSGLEYMQLPALLRFLREEQHDPTATTEEAEALVDLYEIDDIAQENKMLTFSGFLRYMESKHCSIFNQDHAAVYQDMDQPLSRYFISSSHNTYLTGDQLVGQSDLDAYVIALRKGCRCLEIDCWDGPDKEPIVYHGYTLTTKILFRDVISTIEKHAFEVSAYPVILSLENHCSRKQQEVMAQYLVAILGDKLLRAPLDNTTTGELPSPNDLKYKILIKNKKLKQSKCEEATETDVEESAEEEEDDDNDDEEEEDDEQEPDEEAEEEKKLRDKVSFWTTKRRRSLRGRSLTRKKKKVAKSLSDLVIYTCSVKFVSFCHSKDNQSCYENTSLSEMKANKLVKTAGEDFVGHNQRFLSRIYPAGSRTNSSNFNPQKFWNVGAQLVALNFQSLDLAMDLNDGRFLDNGGCGYVLKPDVLMSTKCYNPGSGRPDNMEPTNVLLRVICGSHLPVPGGKTLDPYVKVELYGVPCDTRKEKTPTIKNNSLSPYWGTDMHFNITVPELCLIRFCVRHRSGLFNSEFVGQYSMPLLSMKKGYRWVPLRAQDGCSLDPASLFVFAYY